MRFIFEYIYNKLTSCTAVDWSLSLMAFQCLFYGHVGLDASCLQTCIGVHMLTSCVLDMFIGSLLLLILIVLSIMSWLLQHPECQLVITVNCSMEQ